MTIEEKLCILCKKKTRIIGLAGMCKECFENSFVCYYCGQRKYNKEIRKVRGDKKLCEKCFNSCGLPEIWKLEERNLDWLSTEPAFGVELECILNKKPQIPNEFKSDWGAVIDHSIHTDKGIEYISQPLKFDKSSISKVKAFCDAVQKNHSVTNECGYHVHINAKHISDMKKSGFKEQAMFLKKIWYTYFKLEDFFFSTMPPSRQSNKFCAKFNNDYSITAVKALKGFDLAGYYYNKRKMTRKSQIPEGKLSNNDIRYYWINLHNYMGHLNTVEIRLHSGTLNADKIVKWAKIHNNIVHWISRTRWSELRNMSDNDLIERLPSIIGKSNYEHLVKRIEKFKDNKYSIAHLRQGEQADRNLITSDEEN